MFYSLNSNYFPELCLGVLIKSLGDMTFYRWLAIYYTEVKRWIKNIYSENSLTVFRSSDLIPLYYPHINIIIKEMRNACILRQCF